MRKLRRPASGSEEKAPVKRPWAVALEPKVHHKPMPSTKAALLKIKTFQLLRNSPCWTRRAPRKTTMHPRAPANHGPRVCEATKAAANIQTRPHKSIFLENF